MVVSSSDKHFLIGGCLFMFVSLTPSNNSFYQILRGHAVSVPGIYEVLHMASFSTNGLLLSHISSVPTSSIFAWDDPNRSISSMGLKPLASGSMGVQGTPDPNFRCTDVLKSPLGPLGNGQQRWFPHSSEPTQVDAMKATPNQPLGRNMSKRLTGRMEGLCRR